MPNHVTHKITFDAAEADRVFSSCFPSGTFDFSTLIPPPLHMYLGDLSAQDSEDFKCNWQSWSVENWGTKWNAYSSLSMVEGDKATIVFDTAWSIPYPVLAAFAKKFSIPFEHRYFDEGHNFWGIEEWGAVTWKRDGTIVRIKTRKSHIDDKRALCMELKGYDPDIRDEEEAE